MAVFCPFSHQSNTQQSIAKLYEDDGNEDDRSKKAATTQLMTKTKNTTIRWQR
jgi:hypothetical protein